MLELPSTLLLHFLSNPLCGSIGQWPSTWNALTPEGTRRHFTGYVKFKNFILFRDKH
jgi:hypothetical protein